MRLIDADKIRYRDMSGGSVPDGVWYTFLDDVEKIPTVKAIPVEWIKHWCLKHYPTYPRIVTEELLKKTETWRMIEDWEKENELDKVQ